jgi:hypothetical protein
MTACDEPDENNFGSVESTGGKEETVQFVSGSATGGVDAVKECGGRGEKEIFDESFESIKKRLKGAAPARSMAGRQAGRGQKIFVLKEGR